MIRVCSEVTGSDKKRFGIEKMRSGARNVKSWF